MLGRSSLKFSVAPLVLLWLAVHAALLLLILGVKFLTAKTVVLMMVLAAAALFVLDRRPAPPKLPAL